MDHVRQVIQPTRRCVTHHHSNYTTPRWSSMSAKGMEIAVVGSGIAGLSAAWLLSRRHRVTLYESALRAGGHANTVDVAGVALDTGFIVYNEVTYPNLTALFAHLGVHTKASEMSFAVSMDGGTSNMPAPIWVDCSRNARISCGRASGRCCRICIGSTAMLLAVSLACHHPLR